MKRLALGIVTGGAAAAAFFGSATAHATGETWTPDYNVEGATLVQAPGSTSLTWELPASFTGTGGASPVTLTGTDYVTPSSGGFNDEFVTSTGAIYDQDQLGLGYTNLYYDPNPGSATDKIVDVMKTPFGNVNISSLASYFTPADPSKFITSTDAEQNAGLYSALDLGLKTAPTATSPEHWAPVYGATHEVAASSTGAPVWEQSATFNGTGADSTTLTGTDYLTPSLGGYNNEFVTSGGAIYDQDQLFQGYTNLYYDASSTGTAVDFLKTPFGEFNISPFASFFTPTDYTHVVDATPLADLTNAGLYSALDLGLPAAASGAAADLPTDLLNLF